MAGGTHAGRTYGGSTFAGGQPTTTTGGTVVSMAGATTGFDAGLPSPPSLAPYLKGALSAEALGRPTLVFAQAITMQGGTSSFVGGPIHTGQTFAMLGVTTAEAEGGFTFKQAQYINTLGFTSFAAGLYSTSLTVPMRGATTSQALGLYRTSVTIPISGAVTAEQVSTPIVAQSIPILAVAPSFAAGLYRTSVTIPTAGFTDEQFGRPPPPAQTARPLLAAPSSESAGQPIVGDFKLVGSALSAEGAGQPQVLPGPVYVHPLGEVMTAFGRPSISVTVLPSGILSAENVSRFLPVRAQHHDMLGAASAETFGQPTVPIKPVGAATGAAFGQPFVSVARTIHMQGGASSETPGLPNVGVIVSMQGAPSAEAASLPLVPVGIRSSFAAGGFTFYVPPVDQTLHPAGAASAETFGAWRAITVFVAAQGIPTAAAFGPVHTAPQLRMVGIASGQAVSPAHVLTATVLIWPVTPDEAVGLPSFPSPQTVHMGGAASATSFGGLNWTRAVVAYPIGVSSGEALLGPTFTFGGISRTMQGAASVGVVSPAHYFQTIAIGGAASSEAVGLVGTPLSVSPRGITSSEAFGRPDRLIPGATAKTMQGAASAGAVGRPLLPITVSGAASSEAAGQPTVVHSAVVGSVPSSSAFGQPSIAQSVHPAGASSGFADGRPQLAQTVPLSGTESGEAFGGLTLHATLSVTVADTATSEQLGQPALLEHNDLFPTAVDPAEQLGTPAISQAVNPAGADSSEDFGQADLYATLTVSLAGAVSLEAEGLARVALITYVRPAAASSAAAVGNPKIHRTVPLASANTSEAFGRPQASPGEVRLTPWGITEYPFEPHTPHDKYGEPLVTWWILGGRLSGAASAEHVGVPRQAAQGLHPTGVLSAEQTGQPTAPSTRIRLAGAVSAEHVGRFWDFPVAAVTLAGAPTAQQVGLPAVPAQRVHPAGVPGGAVGAPYLHVSQRAQGVPSSTQLGRPTVVQYLRPAGSITSSAFGLPNQPEQAVRPSTIATAEQLGRFTTPLTVPIGAAAADETLGAPTVAAVYTLRPGPAAPGETWGGPGISTVVRIGLVGAESLEAFGGTTWHSVAFLAPLGTADDEAVGAVAYSVYPTTGAWVDTSVSGIAQMLDASGRSLSVGVLVISQGMSLSGSAASGPALLGQTLPIGTQPVTINPGDGIGVRYIGLSDLIPESVIFEVDGTAKPNSDLFFWHENTETLGAPWTDLDIYWISPTNFPPGSHTVSVTVADVAGHTATMTWEFNSLLGVPGGPT